MLRTMLGISGLTIADHMETTKQTVSNIERGSSKNAISIKLYRMTVLKRVNAATNGNIKSNLRSILNHLKGDNRHVKKHY